MGIVLREWQEKVLRQIPDYYSENDVYVIKAPVGAGKTILSLKIAEKMHADVVFVAVRTTTEQSRFWEDVHKLGMFKPFTFFAKSRQCLLLNSDMRRVLSEEEEESGVECEGCKYRIAINEMEVGLVMDAINAVTSVNPNSQSFTSEVRDRLAKLGINNACSYDAIKTLSRIALKFEIPQVLIGTYPHVFSYPRVLFTRLYELSEELDNPMNFVVIIDEAHNLDRLDFLERAISKHKLDRVINVGVSYCNMIALVKLGAVGSSMYSEAVYACKEFMNKLGEFKNHAESIGRKLNELTREYNAVDVYKRLRSEHVNELLTMLYDFAVNVGRYLEYVEGVVDAVTHNADVVRRFVRTVLLMRRLFDYLQGVGNGNGLESLVDPGVWRFYINNNRLVIKPVTQKPIIEHARRVFSGPWILMSGTMPSREYIEKVWGLKITRYFDVTNEVRIGHRDVRVITSVTSEFRKRGEEMYGKYAVEIRNIVMNNGDGVYLVVYPNYNMMRAVTKYLTDLPFKQVREGEVKHLPDLLDLALSNKKLIIHAVNGGRFTEGIELVKDGQSLIKHIIVAGVPFPNVGDDYVKDRIMASGLGEWLWLKTQAEIATLQVIGRGTRYPNDHVTVWLLDRRFTYLVRDWGLVSY
jgi:Rad3-related DNA helicase